VILYVQEQIKLIWLSFFFNKLFLFQFHSLGPPTAPLDAVTIKMRAGNS